MTTPPENVEKPVRHERLRTALIALQTIFSFLRLVLQYTCR